MFLHHLQSAFLAILSLAIGGYTSWVATSSVSQNMADPGLNSDPVMVAATQAPSELGPQPAPVQSLQPQPTPPLASQANNQSGTGGEQATVSRPGSEVVTASLEYSPETVDYFADIGFGVEYGNSAPVLHKWTDDVLIKVHGTPTSADLDALSKVVRELNNLVGPLSLQLTDQEGDIDIYFVPESRFTSIEPSYVPVNLGFFRIWWDGDGAIYRARILITTQGVTQQERSHLIREELTQSLGLFRDSWKYPDSIFYQGWTDTNAYSSLDRAAISLLYDPHLQPGMTQGEALAVLADIHNTACCAD